MDTDKVWKRFGDVDPYFGVLTWPEFASRELTDEARQIFFQSGEDHVQRVLGTLQAIDPAFSPSRALDFGCGVGRITLPLARRSASVLGVDVSPGMLSEAQKNAREYGIDNVTFGHDVAGNFDFIHSFIVLQHIAPQRGMRILGELLSHVDAGGMIALQFPYNRDAPMWRKAVTAMKRTQPVINGVVNLVQGRRFNYPAMTMFSYDVSVVLTMLRVSGFSEIKIDLEEPYLGYETLMMYGQKKAD